MILRGHHLFCLFGWQGHGYDQAFSEKMDEVVSAIEASDSQIKVVIEPDDLCRACPNLGINGCNKDGQHKEPSIKKHDLRIIDVLGLSDGASLNASELKALISEKKAYLSLEKVCASCSWLGNDYCLNGLKKFS